MLSLESGIMSNPLSQVQVTASNYGDKVPKTVHVLGAGFSCGAGLPLCKDLFCEIDRFMLREYESAFAKIHGERLYSGSHFGDLFYEWWDELRDAIQKSDIFKGIYSIDSEGLINANIETVLNIIDEQLGKKSHQKAPKQEPHYVISTNPETLWRFALVNCLAYYIRWATPKAIESNLQQLTQMAKYFYTFVKPGDTIISFNYDDIIEQMLIEAKNFAPKQGIEWFHGDGYGFSFPIHLFAASELIVPIKTERGSNVHLLNLHGLAKWTWDEKESKLIFDSSITVDTMQVGETRGWTHSRRPLIAEPRREKPLKMKILREIWNAARKALDCADQVIVIGYSLPDNDGAAESMFKSSLRTNEAEIIVIDPAPREEHRIVSLFGNRVAYHQSTLIDFIGFVGKSVNPPD